MPGSSKHAVATILFYDITKADSNLFENYLILSLLLANKIKQLKATSEKKFDSIVYIDKPTFAQLKSINKLNDLIKAYDQVIISDDHEAYFLKLELWKSISKYSSIIYLDSDCYIKSDKSLDLFFEEALTTNEPIVACNETTWPDMFNTGVFAINQKTAISYDKMIDEATSFNTLCNSNSEEVELYDNLDQGLLNYVFSDSWKNVSYVFNVQVRGGGSSASSSDFGSPSETYFVASSTTPSKEDSTKPENESYFDTGYFTYANNVSKSNKKNKFLNKALIVQFMDKPWQTGFMDHVAPDYYSSFMKMKHDMSKKKADEEVVKEALEEKKKDVSPKKKDPEFEFPWKSYKNYPTLNTREWR